MPVELTLTDEDWEILRETYETEVLPAVWDETYDGPELAVTSIGYVEVFGDGDVVAFGRILGNVED